MSSSEYWIEKRVSWDGVKVGLAIWMFALVTLFSTETAIYVTATAAKTDDFDVRQVEPANSDFLTDKDYHLPNCLYCE